MILLFLFLLYTDFSGEIRNFGIFRTDTDFDPSEPVYLPSGQYMGFIGTQFIPRISLKSKNITFVYESQFGFNVWGRNAPEYKPGELRDSIIFKQREIYGEVDGNINVRTGYQHIMDPNKIFIYQWLGGVRVMREKFSYFMGQLPDQTYEGFDLQRNNFTHDVFLFLIDYFGKELSWGTYFLYWGEIVGKPLYLGAFSLKLISEFENFVLQVGGVLQGGFGRRWAGENDETFISGGIVLNPFLRFGRMKFYFDALILSPDVGDYRDGMNTGFLYSGESQNQTLLLTRDELLFRGDNIDEKISENISGNFKIVRPGISVFSISPSYEFDNFEIKFIFGLGLTLNPKNSYGDRFLGFEGDMVLSYFSGGFRFDIAPIFFLPGKASSSYINFIHRDKIRPQFGMETSLTYSF